MPPLQTARSHFDQDISRSRALNEHTNLVTDQALRDDIARAAWMMAVGAVDAYFCDAYADLCARALQAKQIQPTVRLTDRVLNLQIPAFAAIRSAPTENWRWRMAARGIIEKQDVLSIKAIKGLFNGFCRDGHKLFCNYNIDTWIVHQEAKQRLFGVSSTEYRGLTHRNKSARREQAMQTFEDRFKKIFQRRHDCIHNCDRPKVAVISNGLSRLQVDKVIEDIAFLVRRFEDVMIPEFEQWLISLHANATTRNRVL